MINLIPTEQKKETKSNLFIRIFIVCFCALIISFLSASVFLLPAYLYSYSKANTIEKKLEVQKSEEMPKIDQDAQKAIGELNGKLDLIEKFINNKYIVSEKIISELVLKKTEGIKIRKISYVNDQSSGKKIIIGGIANDREALLLFRKSLESSENFKDIELPISNFVKGRDIDFTFDLNAY